MNEVVVQQAPSEEVAEAQADAVETASDAAVEIAEIQADAAVTISADNNDTAVELAQIQADEQEEVLQWLRDQLDGLRASHVSLDQKMETMLIQHQSMLSSLERLSILIPPSMPAAEEPLVEMETPDETVEVVAVPEEAATPKRRWM
jgi:hypothetical protein